MIILPKNTIIDFSNVTNDILADTTIIIKNPINISGKKAIDKMQSHINFTRESNVYKNFTKFNYTTIIGDFISIRNMNSKKKVIYNLEKHIFTQKSALAKGCKDDEYYSCCKTDVKKAFGFIRKYLNVINTASRPSKYKDEFIRMVNSYNIYFQIREMTNEIAYYCPTISSRIIAILHNYMMNDYKLQKCSHCDLYFAVVKLKTKYCPRISSFKLQYSQKAKPPRECGRTAKEAMQYFRLKNSRLEEKIRNIPVDGLELQKISNEFIKKSNSYQTVEKPYSINNLTSYDRFLEDTKIALKARAIK